MGTGGAETQLSNLLIGLKQKGYDVKLVVFYPNGQLEEKIRANNIPIISLNKKSRYDNFSILLKLYKIIKREEPQIVHSYLSMTNIFASMIRYISPKVKIIWGVRNSVTRPIHHKFVNKIEFKIEPYLSRIPDAIISNSFAGKLASIERGFPEDKLYVIPNGVDTQKYDINNNLRNKFRKKYDIEKFTVYGVVGNFNIIKNHELVIDAVERLSPENKEKLRVIFIGNGPETRKLALQEYLNCKKLNQVIFFGQHEDYMEEVYNGLDYLISSSNSEGFSNVITEAMACGKTIICTDCGDNKKIVGQYGIVVKVGDSNSMSLGIEETIGLKYGLEGPRKQIIDNYSIEKNLRRTIEVLESIV